jgi:hypothetical protein
MIHYRHTMQIAPGRQAYAMARAHEVSSTYKQATGVDLRVSVVTTGTLGRLCLSADFESMGAIEASDAKLFAHPEWIALMAKIQQELRDGTAPVVPNTYHDEFWRDA